MFGCCALVFTMACSSYYKNIRREWASLVATPPSARFQDALAFTRSLGDLHLHTYGKATLIIYQAEIIVGLS